MKIRLIFLFLAIVACTNLGVSKANMDETLETSCIGSKSAKAFFIYLHGRDSNPPSSQELSNREMLNKIAQKENILIALPRSKALCLGKLNSYC